MTEEEIGETRRKSGNSVRLVHQRRARPACSTRPTTAPCAAPSATTCSGWAGKIIVVFPTMVEFRGKMVPGIAGAHPAAEAGHCRKRPGDGTVGKAEADNGSVETASIDERERRAAGRSRLIKPSLDRRAGRRNSVLIGREGVVVGCCLARHHPLFKEGCAVSTNT